MNWLKEINAFYAQQLRQPLSPKAVVVYHYLMYCASKCFWSWPLEMRLDALSGACNISRSAAKLARDELKNAGILHIDPGVGSRSAKYTIMSCIYDPEAVTKDVAKKG